MHSNLAKLAQIEREMYIHALLMHGHFYCVMVTHSTCLSFVIEQSRVYIGVKEAQL